MANLYFLSRTNAFLEYESRISSRPPLFLSSFPLQSWEFICSSLLSVCSTILQVTNPMRYSFDKYQTSSKSGSRWRRKTLKSENILFTLRARSSLSRRCLLSSDNFSSSRLDCSLAIKKQLSGVYFCSTIMFRPPNNVWLTTIYSALKLNCVLRPHMKQIIASNVSLCIIQ